MDITAIADLSTSLSQSQLMTNVSTAVLNMTLDSFKSQGDEIRKLMESSVQPNLGQHFDQYI